MSALTFTLREAPAQRLDLSPLVPQRLAGLDAAAIERIALHTTRIACCVGDVFGVAMGDPDQVVIAGGSERLDRVGAAMATGSLLVEGDVGQCAGRAMTGGTLTVQGRAGHHAASGMRGGRLTVGGAAGDDLGGPLAGERIGMAGGVVLVRGDAGARAGHRLRRGLVVVEGDVGEAAACGMFAGTVIVCGHAGADAGFMMRRGTLLLAHEPAGGQLPTFVPAAGYTDVFAGLLARSLQRVSTPASALARAARARLIGDAATLGRGEILLA